MKTLYSKTIVFSLLKKSFVILCTLIIMLTMIPTTFAAYGPSSADLKEIGSQIEYPKEKEYLDDYAYGTIIAPKGHSAFAASRSAIFAWFIFMYDMMPSAGRFSCYALLPNYTIFASQRRVDRA